MNQTAYQAKQLIKLALPILIAQVTQTMMGFIDTVMAGRVSATDMAAVAVGTSLWMPTILFVQGLLLIFTSFISHHYGANNLKSIPPLAYQGFYIGLIGATLVILLLSFSEIILSRMALEPELFKLAWGYISAVKWGAPAFVLYQVLRCCSEGISFTKPTMIIGFVGLLINIPGNYIFINGHLGMPALGGAGCGVATALVIWGMFIAMTIYVVFSKKFQPLKLFSKLHLPDLKIMKYMFIAGLPVAMAILFEVSLFAVIALLLAPLGSNIVASHQIALNFSTLVFMLPLSIGMAVTIRIGYYLGRNQPDTAKTVTKVGLKLGFSLAVFTALITFIFKNSIAYLYNDNPTVVFLAAGLMFLAALYQLSDSIQVIAAGALRGYKDTKSAFYITLVSYWGVGMVLGYILGKTDLIIPAMGAKGFWIGLIAGLSTAAILFALRLAVVQKRHQI